MIGAAATQAPLPQSFPVEAKEVGISNRLFGLPISYFSILQWGCGRRRMQYDSVANTDNTVSQNCRLESTAMIERLEDPGELRDLYQMTARFEETDAAHPDVTDHKLSVQQIDQGNTPSYNVSAGFLRNRFESEFFCGELEHFILDKTHGFIGPGNGVP